MGAAVPLPLKGARGVPAIEGAMPLTKIGFANTSIPLPVPPIKNEPPMRGSFTLPEFVPPKPQLPRFGAMILDEERVFGESRRWERTFST